LLVFLNSEIRIAADIEIERISESEHSGTFLILDAVKLGRTSRFRRNVNSDTSQHMNELKGIFP
jgi:hypothetical protein